MNQSSDKAFVWRDVYLMLNHPAAGLLITEHFKMFENICFRVVELSCLLVEDVIDRVKQTLPLVVGSKRSRREIAEVIRRRRKSQRMRVFLLTVTQVQAFVLRGRLFTLVTVAAACRFRLIAVITIIAEIEVCQTDESWFLFVVVRRRRRPLLLFEGNALLLILTCTGMRPGGVFLPMRERTHEVVLLLQRVQTGFIHLP